MCIIGATGAVGKELVRYIINTETKDRISELTLLIRSPLPEWQELLKEEDTSEKATWFKSNVKFIKRDNFDDLTDL